MRTALSSYALPFSFGIPGYPVETPLALEDFLDRAARWGYPGVQIADNTPLARLETREREALWQQARTLGLFVEVGARGLTRDNLDRHLEIASEVSSPILRFVIDGPGFEPAPDEIPRLLEEASDRCGEHGTILAIENHDRFRAGQMDRWFKDVNSPFLGLCLDCVNSYGCGEGFGETMSVLLPHVVNLHLKDFRVRRQPHMLGFLIEGTPVGEGFLPMRELMDRLRDLGKCQTAVVEHWPALEDTMEATLRKEVSWCERSLQNMKTLGEG